MAKDEAEVRDEYDFEIMKRKISDDNALRVIVEYDTGSELFETAIDMNETPPNEWFRDPITLFTEELIEELGIVIEPHINFIRMFSINLLYIFSL